MAIKNKEASNYMKKQYIPQNPLQPGWLVDTLDAGLNRILGSRVESPVLPADPEIETWYRLPLSKGISGDGSEFHIYLKKGTSSHLCLFFSGGGMAWNAYTAARPTTGGKVALGLPNFYWNNLRPFTEIYNIYSGIMQIGNEQNPFRDWNIVVISYATGDLHLGNTDFSYTTEEGESRVLHFRGYTNFKLAMTQAVRIFPDPASLLIAGDSAGGFAVPALTRSILENFYPRCRNVTVFSDSAQLLYPDWRATLRDTWKAGKEIWQSVRSDNLTVDLYRTLYRQYKDRLHYLYAGSPRDAVLSSYYNDVAHHTHRTTLAVQEVYERQMRQMILELKDITESFGCFIYPFPSALHPGGTVHTAVRHQRFYWKTRGGSSMATWLHDAVNGQVRDENLDLLAIKR